MSNPNHNESFELNRNACSPRTSLRQYSIGEDDDDHGDDLLAMGISDGFRPVEITQTQSSSHVTRLSMSSPEPPVARAVSPRPSSTAKPYSTQESLSLWHDGLERPPVRPSSVSTSSTFVPVGPSFPYHMYPQDVQVARTASLSTTATMPVSERSSNGRLRSLHPYFYGTYPQSVSSADDEVGHRAIQRDINVGFPGRADRYQRRLGPDGEEAADMIGPHGHTEQLPPYTERPDGAHVREALNRNVTQFPPAPSPAQLSQRIPGAGGLGLATRNPEFESMEDLGQLHSSETRQSVGSFNSEASHQAINEGARGVMNEKSTSNWKSFARRKVCGIVPCWAVGLAGIVLLLLAGIVIGAVVGPHLRKDPPHDKYGLFPLVPSPSWSF